MIQFMSDTGIPCYITDVAVAEELVNCDILNEELKCAGVIL